MRLPALLSLVLASAVLAGCATGAGGSRTFEHPLALRQNTPSAERAEAPVHRTVVPLAAERLAEEVPGVYEYLGLEAAASGDTERFTFYTPGMDITGRLYEGVPNSRYIDCGADMQGERADVFAIRFAMVTRLRPREDGGTVVETRLEGIAQDRYVNEQPVFCIGTGELESEIATLLRVRGAS